MREGGLISSLSATPGSSSTLFTNLLAVSLLVTVHSGNKSIFLTIQSLST